MSLLSRLGSCLGAQDENTGKHRWDRKHCIFILIDPLKMIEMAEAGRMTQTCGHSP